MTIEQFKNKVVLWLLSNGLSAEVLRDKRLEVPLRMKDPVWVIEETIRVGGRDYAKLDETKKKLELMMITQR